MLVSRAVLGVCVCVCVVATAHRLALLNGLKASDSISEEQSRQLLFDLDSGYSAFHHWLRSKESGGRK